MRWEPDDGGGKEEKKRGTSVILNKDYQKKV